MAFKVRMFTDAADFESLHVAKLTTFPLEPRDYKPYSQARVCFSPEGLHLQLLSFEATPLPVSRMTAVFSFSSKLPVLEISIDAAGQASAQAGDTAAAVTAHLFTGEDLQGVYWGGNILIPAAELERIYGFAPEAGVKFAGNLYKLCSDPARPHYGCFYPADFARALSDPRNLGEFEVIDY